MLLRFKFQRNTKGKRTPVPFLTPATRGRPHLKPNHRAHNTLVGSIQVVTVFKNNCILCVFSIYVKIKSLFF